MSARSPSENELNPYQAPATADRSVIYSGTGVGVWRDGDKIVMHEEAQLPPICIKTGVPTTRRLVVWANWAVPKGTFRIAPPRIAIPLSQGWRIFAASCNKNPRGLAFVVFLPTVLVAMIFEQAWGLRFGALMHWGAMAGAVIFLVALGWVSIAGDLLECVRSEGQYHWLQGACEQFLNQLPQWQRHDNV